MRKILGLAAALLLAGCHGAHVVSQSQPAVSESIAATAPAGLVDSTLTATVTAPWAAAPAQPVAVAPSAASTPRTPPTPPRQAERLRPLARLATATIAKPAAKRWVPRLRRQRPTEGTAENGLGGIALFFIGVVLALLVGLAALVSLIPGVSFWGGLGLAAAGLLVLFLLYSLFSGGKKK